MDLQIFDLLCPIFYPLYPNECLKIVIGDISNSASTLSFDLILYYFQDFQTWIFEITVERSSHRILSKNWPNISILASIWTLDPAQTRSKSNILKSFAFQENRYKKET